MTTELATLKGIMVLGTKVIAPALMPTLMVADGVISETTLLPLTIVAAVGGACWYIGGFVRGVHDERQIYNRRFMEIEKLLKELKQAADDAKAHHQRLCPVIGCQVDFNTGKIHPKRNLDERGND